MADTNEFFNAYLPKKIASNPDLADTVNAIIQFDIEGAGTWTVNLKDSAEVNEGATDDNDCVISCAKEDWENLLDNPSLGMTLFMSGKLKASNLALATKIQNILG
jgi:putative sterol carrier protein